ncbi:MAG: hypothetical protein LC808_43730 [Actinobacteria bacterium]|nr:hypothetical protein [Actinomycetota bacterium]
MEIDKIVRAYSSEVKLEADEYDSGTIDDLKALDHDVLREINWITKDPQM